MKTHSVDVGDGVSLHVRERGTGDALLFLHEFAGDHRSWQPQIARFVGRYRCVTYSARGYYESDVPDDVGAYSQDLAVQDAHAVLDALGIERVHLVGLSMGAFTALHLSLRIPKRAASLTLAGIGYGTMPDVLSEYRQECLRLADALEGMGIARFADQFVQGPARVQFRDKDPRGYEAFTRRLTQQSVHGIAQTLRVVQAARPSLIDVESTLREHRIPTLVLVGDQDVGALDGSWWLARTLPHCALGVLPGAGHTLNLEEPELVNAMMEAFLAEAPTGFARYRLPELANRTGMPIVQDRATPIAQESGPSR